MYRPQKLVVNIVDKQLEAYNNQDIGEFLKCYSDNIKVYMLQDHKLLTDGKEQLRETMTAAFETNPESRTILMNRIIQGDLVVDQEKITNHFEDKEIRSMAIYQVEGNLITKLWFGGRTVE